MDKLKFYTVNRDYLNYLRGVDDRVAYVEGDNYKVEKPYIGVVLEVGGHKFFAPLSSYKVKQDKINNVSVFKIHEKGNSENKLGIVHLAKMIPVPDAEVHLLDMNALDAKYKSLMYKQFEYLKSNKDALKDDSQKLYDYVVVVRDAFFRRISCDFGKLIDASKIYKK